MAVHGPFNPSDPIVRLQHEPTWTASFVEGVVNWEEAGGVWKIAAYVAAFVASFIVLVSVVFSPAFFTGVREYEAIHLEKEFQKQVPSRGSIQTEIFTEVGGSGKLTAEQAEKLKVSVELRNAMLQDPELLKLLAADRGLRQAVAADITPDLTRQITEQLQRAGAGGDPVAAAATAVELQTLRARVQTLDQEARTQSTFARDAARERNAFAGQVEILKTEAARLTQQIAQQKAATAEAVEGGDARIGQLTREKAELTRRLDEAGEALGSSEKTIAQLREAVGTAERSATEQRQRAKALDDTRLQLELDVAAAKNELSAKTGALGAQLKAAQEEVRSLTAQLATASEGAGEQVKALQTQLQAKGEALAKATVKIADLESQVADARAVAGRFEKDAQTYKKQAESSLAENREHVKALEEGLEHIKRLGAQNTQLGRDKVDLQRLLDTASTELEAANGKVGRLEKQLATKNADLAAAQHELEGLREQYATAQKQGRAALAKAEEESHARENAERQLKATQAKANEDISALQAQLEAATRKAAAQLQAKTEEVTRLSAQVEKLSSTADKDGAVAAANAELRAQLAKLEADLGATIVGGGMVKAVADLKKDLRDAQAAASTAKSAIALAQGGQQRAEEALRKQQAEFLHAKSEKTGLEKEIAALKVFKVALGTLSDKDFLKVKAGNFAFDPEKRVFQALINA